MRHIQKLADSEILSRELTYNKSRHRSELRRILELEQKGFCAYTDKNFKSEASTLDHFKPQSIVSEEEDGYHNWFAVSYTVNVVEKRAQWKEPILHPTDPSIVERIFYKEKKNEAGKTVVVCEYALDDEAAKNFVEIVGLNSYILTIHRANFLASLRTLLERGFTIDKIKANFLTNPMQVDFHRLTEWELGVTL